VSQQTKRDIVALQGAVGNQVVQRRIAPHPHVPSNSAGRAIPPTVQTKMEVDHSTVADTSSLEVTTGCSGSRLRKEERAQNGADQQREGRPTLVDRRPEAAAHSELPARAQASPTVARHQTIQRMADTSPRRPMLRGTESGGFPMKPPSWVDPQ
jgi:hypothetical protein